MQSLELNVLPSHHHVSPLRTSSQSILHDLLLLMTQSANTEDSQSLRYAQCVGIGKARFCPWPIDQMAMRPLHILASRPTPTVLGTTVKASVKGECVHCIGNIGHATSFYNDRMRDEKTLFFICGFSATCPTPTIL